ncbi:MAG TPA: polyribonucleotide nucleotidyltransferase, partial [Candidatus Saccharimonadales bacterium]|nr:polyribonucleotide nucleotidyltransferase [Candidatus Saccharimonadales bacterium]
MDGKFKAFASPEELNQGQLDLVVAGTKDGVLMVEAGANEVSEKQMAEAIDWGYKAIQPAIKLQQELVKKLAPPKQEFTLVLPDAAIQADVNQWLEGKIGDDLRKPYPERNVLVQRLKDEMHDHFASKMAADQDYLRDDFEEAFMAALHKDVREGIVKDGIRPDGRKLTEIRPIECEVSVLPRVHGSSLFSRGLTQAINAVTLAPLSYVQLIDTMEKEGERRYIHHYNAPGYTVGEVKRLGSPGRREIGHGYLAERAVSAVLPSEEDFPYMIRSVTEIMSQNGSTSMAATCSSWMALLDAGVPLKAPVSGIAMGLMLDGGQAYVLSDIADAEDFAGDMDFKV